MTLFFVFYLCCLARSCTLLFQYLLIALFYVTREFGRFLHRGGDVWFERHPFSLSGFGELSPFLINIIFVIGKKFTLVKVQTFGAERLLT